MGGHGTSSRARFVFLADKYRDFQYLHLRCVDTTGPIASPVKKSKRPARPRAIVVAEHGEKPIALGTQERALLGEALRRAEDMRVTVEASNTGYARWLLGELFHDDTRAALDHGTQVWSARERAGDERDHVGR